MNDREHLGSPEFAQPAETMGRPGPNGVQRHNNGSRGAGRAGNQGFNPQDTQMLNLQQQRSTQQQVQGSSLQHVDHVVLEENPLDLASDKDFAVGENRFNALSSIGDDVESNRLFDINSIQGTASQFGEPTMTRQRYNKEQLDKLREKNEANNRLYNFRKVYTRSNITGASQASMLQEKLKLIPKSFKDGDWQEPLLYAYFALNYFDEEVFRAVIQRANHFNSFQELRVMFSNPPRAYLNLTAQQVHLDRLRLNHLAFDAALDKDFADIADHFIQSSSVQLTWTMVRKMLQNRQEKLVKQCIKFNTKFESSDAQTKRLIFAGRASVQNEDRTIRLVDFIHIMLELRWKSSTIIDVIDGYSNKNKMNSNDLREMFLLFAIKRKIKLMSYLVNNEHLGFEIRVDNFLDIIENCAYDVGVLFYREYFLHLNVQEDRIVGLLVNSFSETNGMLESKAYLLKRFIKHMKYEQAIKFLEAIEKGVTSKSRSNILILTLNVVKSSCLLIELLERVRDSFGFLDRRITEIRQEIVAIAQNYLNQVENEEEMQYLLLEEDIDYRDSLNVVYDYQVVELLENPFAQKIVKNIWESKYNVSSSIMSTSTVHNLLFNFNHCRYDMEKVLRFNSKKDLKDFGTHGFQFETWRSSAKSRYFTFAIGFLINGIVMHSILLTQIKQSLDLRNNSVMINDALKNPDHDMHQHWVDYIYDFEQRAMTITYLMYSTWMFTFQHIFEAVFAAKNKREAKFTLFENILDFWIMVMGMIYITIVYKVYRWNTFIIKREKLGEVTVFWDNWKESTDRIEDHWFLLIIDFTYWIKVAIQLRLMPIIGIAYTVFLVLLRELVAFGIFFFLFQFIFAIIGNLLFFDDASYDSFSTAMMTIFKAASGIFSKEDIIGKKGEDAENQLHYTFIISYVLICFILIMNLIVGKLASAYRKIVRKRDVLMLLETLSVREASEADEKYSAAVSAPYPLNMLNMLFGVYVLSVKNPLHNKVILHIYYLPTMVTCLLLFVAYSFAMIPLCYVKMVAHKFALVVKNPQGYGSKTKSDRLGYALYFMALGPFILFLDCCVDIWWFGRHMYTTELAELAQQKLEDRGYGVTNSIDQRTFKKMLHYFNMKTGSDQQQIALQRDVSVDIREYLHVEDAIQTMVLGDHRKLFVSKPQFYEMEKQANKTADAVSNTVMDTSAVNNTQMNLISQRDEKSDEVAETEPKRKKNKKNEKKEATPYDLALDQVKEYCLVKDMLINNSLPVVDGRYSSDGGQAFSRQLIIDKKILLNLLIDLQRFRKLLNLKKSFYIFHVRYSGKPEDMKKWHQKVEVRVTQTFKQLNIRRLIDIIGYDPSQYFKGEMSFQKVEMIKQGRYGDQMYQSNNVRESIPYNIESSNVMQRRMPLGQPLGLERKDSTNQQREVEGVNRLENLNQNLNQLVNRYEVASLKLKEAVDALKRQQMGQRPGQASQIQVERQASAFSIASLVHDEQDRANVYRGGRQDLHAQLKPTFSKDSFGLAGAGGHPVLQSLNQSPLAQLARPHDIRQALVENPSIQEQDQDGEVSDCDVDDSVDAGNADSDAANNYGSRLRVNDTAQDFYQSQAARPHRRRSIAHTDVQKH